MFCFLVRLHAGQSGKSNPLAKAQSESKSPEFRRFSSLSGDTRVSFRHGCRTLFRPNFLPSGGFFTMLST